MVSDNIDLYCIAIYLTILLWRCHLRFDNTTRNLTRNNETLLFLVEL